MAIGAMPWLLLKQAYSMNGCCLTLSEYLGLKGPRSPSASWVISSHPDEYLVTGFRWLWRSEAGDLHSLPSLKVKYKSCHYFSDGMFFFGNEGQTHTRVKYSKVVSQ